MPGSFKYALIGLVPLVMVGSLVGLYTGADKETWKMVAPAVITGVFSQLQRKDNDGSDKPNTPA